MLTVAGTGHRPNKVGGYNPIAYARLVQLAQIELATLGATEVISGMALGWDQALVDAAIEAGIPFHAYLPFQGQASVWPPRSQDKYSELLKRAKSVRICSPGGYSAMKMQVRNQCMVDDCGKLLALWDGSPGGTANCVRYAHSVQRPVENCWSRFEEMRR